jgi:hypothetical protein
MIPRARCRKAATSVRTLVFLGSIAVTAAVEGPGCATARLPPPGVAERAAAADSYSARMRVTVKGPELRARTSALVGFERPDSLRVEIPGPVGARLVAVTREGRLTAVFPGERALYQDSASAASLEALLGVRLTPAEVMDLLVGKAPASVARYRAVWGTTLPREIDAMLVDGTRLDIRVEESEADLSLPPAAFEAPPHEGYRRVDAHEARQLWGGR